MNTGPVAWKCPQCGGNLPPSQGYAVCPFCGSSLILPEGSGQAAPPQPVRGIRLKPLTCPDNQGTGLEVFHMLIPEGWQAQGGCHWNLENPGMPAVVSVQVWNPAGDEGFEILPNLNFIFNEHPLTAVMFPPGSHYFGAEVQQPVGIAQAFSGYVLPRCRAWAENLQVSSWEPLPDLPRLVRSDAPLTPGASAEGGKIRLRYHYRGRAYEEEIYGVVEVFRAPGSITWFIDYLFSFRAGAGRLDATADLFTVMIQSFKLNPQWYSAFKTVALALIQAQIRQIQHTGRVGDILAQAGSEIRQQNLNEWYSRQETYDRLAVDRSRSIRGVDGFYDPHREEVVELPAGYGHAWANNLGGYILTEDPNFNPNLESGQHWEPMQPQSP